MYNAKPRYGILPSLDRRNMKSKAKKLDYEDENSQTNNTHLTNDEGLNGQGQPGGNPRASFKDRRDLTSNNQYGAYLSQKGPSSSQNRYNKSLPRLGAGRKLEKMPKNKQVLTPENNNRKFAKNPLGNENSRNVAHEDREKVSSSGLMMTVSHKTLAGFAEGRTKTNQDSIFVNSRLKNSNKAALFGAFDGHGTLGHRVSQFLVAKLREAVELRFDPEKEYAHLDYEQILDSACVDINTQLVANTSINSTLSGSTGIVVLLHNDLIVCGNVGDSRAGVAVFTRSDDPGRMEMLSRDHTPNEPDEKERITKAGGSIMACIGRLD